MTKITIIAIIDKNRGLGKDNNLLCYLPADLSHFKQLTMGKPVIMGGKTYRSIGRTLPGRLNIIISRCQQSIAGAIVVSSLEEAIEQCKLYEETMIIGGGQIYAAALELAETLYITVIDHCFNADVFFPAIDENRWTCTKLFQHNKDQLNAYDMTFFRYDLKKI
ncbi:MAG: dihydrofolate reductase [Legionella sp.]